MGRRLQPGRQRLLELKDRPARLRDLRRGPCYGPRRADPQLQAGRDIRDLLAADQLETATYDLLARAAERADDPDTASLAQQLGVSERTAADRLTAELDAALEIALLAE